MTSKRTTSPDERRSPITLNPRKPQPVRCSICKLEFLPWRSGQEICTRDHSALDTPEAKRTKKEQP
jgi:hypothetical protein